MTVEYILRQHILYIASGGETGLSAKDAAAQINQLIQERVEDQLIFVSKMLSMETVTKEHLKEMVDNRLTKLRN